VAIIVILVMMGLVTERLLQVVQLLQLLLQCQHVHSVILDHDTNILLVGVVVVRRHKVCLGSKGRRPGRCPFAHQQGRRARGRRGTRLVRLGERELKQDDGEDEAGDDHGSEGGPAGGRLVVLFVQVRGGEEGRGLEGAAAPGARPAPDGIRGGCLRNPLNAFGSVFLLIQFLEVDLICDHY